MKLSLGPKILRLSPIPTIRSTLSVSFFSVISHPTETVHSFRRELNRWANLERLEDSYLIRLCSDLFVPEYHYYSYDSTN